MGCYRCVGIVVMFADGAKLSFKLYTSLSVKKSVVSQGNLLLKGHSALNMINIY
jgi:hypothetical protein